MLLIMVELLLKLELEYMDKVESLQEQLDLQFIQMD